MKKLILTGIAMLMFAVPTMANDSVTVYSNGNEVADKGVIIEGRTMVPVRGVFEYMGYDVSWDANTKTATLTNTKKNSTITLTNGENTFNVNDKVVTPDVPQQIVNGRFMLPLRAVGEAVDAKIGWLNDSKIATINENNSFFNLNPVGEDDESIKNMPVNELK
ncbi:MAG: copper amine oxidase N-terminal domain-containing protein [Lachnospirales bacterium]